MPRFHSSHDMPFSAGIYCCAPCMAATRERKVPILRLEIQPSSIPACPALMLPVPGRGSSAQTCPGPRVRLCLHHSSAPTCPAVLSSSILLLPYLHPSSITVGVAWGSVSQAGDVLSHERTPAAAQLNRDVSLLCTTHTLHVGSTHGLQAPSAQARVKST